MVFNAYTGSHRPGVQDYLFNSKVTLQLILAIYLASACLIFA